MRDSTTDQFLLVLSLGLALLMSDCAYAGTPLLRYCTSAQSTQPSQPFAVDQYTDWQGVVHGTIKENCATPKVSTGGYQAMCNLENFARAGTHYVTIYQYVNGVATTMAWVQYPVSWSLAPSPTNPEVLVNTMQVTLPGSWNAPSCPAG
jgi:hypothetical protein